MWVDFHFWAVALYTFFSLYFFRKRRIFDRFSLVRLVRAAIQKLIAFFCVVNSKKTDKKET